MSHIPACTTIQVFSTESPRTVRALFYGLGSDGTVGANKNSIKIIGENKPNYAQGYFVYDSKKAGSVTVSHLRFGPEPICSTYLISKASFVACHQFSFLDRMDVLSNAEPGAVFLLNAPYGPKEVWEHLPRKVQQQIIEKKLRFFVIDARIRKHRANVRQHEPAECNRSRDIRAPTTCASSSPTPYEAIRFARIC